ncbi:hypothetical protein CAPTEDRAFT_201978 [Capitella teleta]|uniref:TM2 domain-containing protein n=1 Tax=Capitella teleta TaxID=283909 RepID=R7UUR5_CAPTE|nr:hypothetical protein CAPTEDRAFT_201978 [Capitella teleta]|eukprot:ELU09930.1 hypothetical protein CAPTEDRAFT_201978 [Capitella teleta]
MELIFLSHGTAIKCIFLFYFFDSVISTDEAASPPLLSLANLTLNCDELMLGQYYCEDPVIDHNTQQAAGCPEETRLVNIKCFPMLGLECKGLIHGNNQSYFTKKAPCKWTNGKHFSVALLLSVFLGWLGVDRFYLGYPAIGMLKFCTFGFMFLGHLIDMLLIAIQVVTPADGSMYIVDYYGAGLTRLQSDNETFVRPPDYL